MAWRNGQAYSQDLRDRVLALLDDGLGAYEIAETLRVSPTYVYRVRREAATGRTTAGTRSGGTPSPLRAHEDAMRARMRDVPDTTIMAMRSWLLTTHAVSASVGAVWLALRRLGLTHKKSRCARRSRTGPTSHGRERRGRRVKASNRADAGCSSTKQG